MRPSIWPATGACDATECVGNEGKFMRGNRDAPRRGRQSAYDASLQNGDERPARTRIAVLTQPALTLTLEVQPSLPWHSPSVTLIFT
jgi:hypothetical protein